jgi:transposase-like protein
MSEAPTPTPATSDPAPAAAGAARAPKKEKIRRRRQGTARWHLSRRAVDISLPEVLGWDEKRCREFLIEARWGGPDSIRCPHCGTATIHYARPLEKRWACRGCRRCFSLLSGTVFDSHKLTVQELVAAALMWMNSSAGQPALELRRHMRRSYNTAFVLHHKLREALCRGYNVGLLNGDLEVGGSHQSGRRSWEKRGRALLGPGITSETPKEEVEAAMSESARKEEKKRKKKEGLQDPDTKAVFNVDRRRVIAVRKRSGKKGLGAVASRVAVVLLEDDKLSPPVLEDFAAIQESELNSDSATAYHKIGQRFRVHHTVEHGAMLVGPKGENSNLAEELNFRLDRAEQGMYLNIEPKYLHDYAVEVAFRSDTRRLSNKEQLKLLLHVALNVGVSQDWRGFTHGRHRKVERLHRNPTAAPSSGPAKGRKRGLPR